MSNLSPLLKWSGGKQDELVHILPHIPNDFDIYIEPFVGGGAVFFHVCPQKAVIADVHTDLVDFYWAIQQGYAKNIHEFMEAHPNNEETYYLVRDQLALPSRLEKAQKFFYERKTCFRGMLRYNKKGQFNIPFGKYKTIQYSNLLDGRYEQLLKRTEIWNDTFDMIFECYNDPRHFVFLDPPYDSEFTNYGYCSFGHDEHRRLAHYFKTTKSRCLMIIGKTPFIEELYKGYIVGDYAKKYKFKLYGKRVDEKINTTHLIIKNYA